jgi:microcystin degradation protein MlrC
MPHIAHGGFQHETNTFAPTKADYAAFERGGGWPARCHGAAIDPAVGDANIPLAGFLGVMRGGAHRLSGTVWANATPSAHVTRDAFERISGILTDELKRLDGVGAVYVDLHGAMVCEHCDDGEGEILARIRAIVGPRVPVVASLDLHANVTARMVEMSDGLVSYRTYPHVDQGATGARAARLLEWMLQLGERPAKAFRQLDYLIPLNAQCTLIEPGKGLYELMGRIERETGTWLSFNPGFPMADIADCGPSVVGYGPDRARVEAAVEQLAQAVADAERDFGIELLQPDAAVRRAIARGEPGAPVVLADTQDNPGAGGNGDTTGLLAALIRNRAEDAVLGLLYDPASATQAHAAGVGAELTFRLGEISGVPGHAPYEGRFTVERLGDGFFTCTGPFYRGNKMRLGPMALLRQGGVRVALTSHKVQCADQEMFRHLGVEPVRQRIVALKSSVHFRADFQAIAREVLVVVAPGPAKADPRDLNWTKLRSLVRLTPLGRPFSAR